MDEVEYKVLQARVTLLMKYPFWGSLATRLTVIDGSKWCPTAATDGRNFYYNRDFIKKLKPKELVFLVAHEIGHAMYDHIGRRGTRDPSLWNMATDYIINYALVSRNVGEMIANGLYDKRYTDELTSDEVYKILKQDNVQIKMPMDMHLDLSKPNTSTCNTCGGTGKVQKDKNDQTDQNKDKDQDQTDDQSGDQGDQGDEGNQPGENGQDGQGQAQGDQSGNNPGEGKGSGCGHDHSHDQHNHSHGDEGEPCPDCKGSGRQKQITVSASGSGNGDGPPTLTEEDLKEIRERLISDIISAAQTHGAGSVPAGILRMIEELVEPKLDWRQLLDQHIKSAAKDDYTFQRFSRRTWSSNGFIFPGQDFDDTIDAVVAIDTSGSMTQEMLTDFLSEVKGIMQEFEDFKLRIFTFDTQVYDLMEYTPENSDDIVNYPMRGGGGTMFECAWEFMKENDIMPQRFVLLTDGYPNRGWGDEDYCETLFIIHGQNRAKAPFGQTAYYDDAKKKGS